MSQISLSKPGAAPMAALSLGELERLVERELVKAAINAFHGHVEARKIADTKIRDLTVRRQVGSAALIEEMKALQNLKKLVNAQRAVTGVSGVLEVALAAADEAYRAKGTINDDLLKEIAVEREARANILREMAAIRRTPGWALYVGQRGSALRRQAAEKAEAEALAAAKAIVASGVTPDTDTLEGEAVAEFLAYEPAPEPEPVVEEAPRVTKTQRRKANKAPKPEIDIEEMPCHVKARSAKGGDSGETAVDLYAAGMTPAQVRRAMKEAQNA